MSKHFGCKDCCKYQTDACDNPMYAEIGKHLCPTYAMDIEYCYEKGRAEAIDEFVEKCEVKIQKQNIEIEYECPFLDIIDIQMIAKQLKEQKHEKDETKA